MKRLETAAKALAAGEEKVEAYGSVADQEEDDVNKGHWEKTMSLWRTQREEKRAECDSFVEQLKDVNVPSGLLPAQDFAAVCKFAQRVAKRKVRTCRWMCCCS